MSRRGNDLVRRYLWMAALSAVQLNPAVRALYARVVAKHPEHKAIAIGHAMRKLLHLAFAVWKSGQPFDPKHYPWEAPAHGDGDGASSDGSRCAMEQGAGRGPQAGRAGTVSGHRSLCRHCSRAEPAVGEGTCLDFAHLKRQLPLARVLDHLGLSPRLRGRGRAAALRLPDPPRRRPGPDVQREPGRERLPLLRRHAAAARAT